MTIPTPQRIFAAIALLALLSSAAHAQASAGPPPSDPPAAAASAPAFELADVHVSPHSTNTDFTGGVLHGDRYLLHNATMVDILSLAYGVDNDNILAGPPEIDTINPTSGSAGDTNLPMSVTGENMGCATISTNTYPDPQGEVIWTFNATSQYPGEIDGTYSINLYSNPLACYIGSIVLQNSSGTVYSPDFNICYP